MTKITLTKTHQNPPQIQQSRLKRDWMDETYNKHAYKCLPMSAANVNGWELVLQQDVVVQWDGGNTTPRVLEGEFLNERPVVIPSIIGIISFVTLVIKESYSKRIVLLSQCCVIYLRNDPHELILEKSASN
jgi:hypothetical protein